MSATTASAQLSTGSLSGTVVDAQRAPIQNAEVTITNVATLEKVSTVTGMDGSFHANSTFGQARTLSLSLRPASNNCSLKVLPVSVGSDLGLGKLQLNIGETSTTITVRSASGLVERTEPQLSQSFGTDKLTSLPGIQENQRIG